MKLAHDLRTTVVFGDKSQSDNMQEHIEQFLELQVQPLTLPEREDNESGAPHAMSYPPQATNVINEPAAPLPHQLYTSTPVYIPYTPTTSIPVQPQDVVASTNTATFQTNSPVVMADPNVVQPSSST